MTRTPIEIATALKRLERYSPEIHPMVAEAAAMLRENRKLRDFNIRFTLSLSLINTIFVVLAVLMPWW